MRGDLIVYEFVSPQFRGGTAETDPEVFWIAARTYSGAESLAKRLGLHPTGERIPLEYDSYRDLFAQGVDMITEDA